MSARFAVRDWVKEHYKLKFRLAGHIARRIDDRWSTKLLTFVPESGRRGRGRPLGRWEDSINQFFQHGCALQTGDWKELVSGRQVWAQLVDDFCDYHVR